MQSIMGFGECMGLCVLRPSYGRNGYFYLYVDLYRASASVWSFVSYSLHIKLLVSFIHATVCNYSYILSLSTMTHYLNKSLFIHSNYGGHLGYVQCEASKENAALDTFCVHLLMNVCEQHCGIVELTHLQLVRPM